MRGASRNCRCRAAAASQWPLLDESKLFAYIGDVIRTFKSKALSELWTKGKSSKIDAKMQKRIFARLDRLDVALRAEEMNIPGFDFHALHGFNPETLFGPRQWTVVHHVRIRRWRRLPSRFRAISLKEQTWSMQPSAVRTAAPPIPARYFATTLFRLPAGPRRISPACSEFRASTSTTSWENESRYLPPSPYASASFSATAPEFWTRMQGAYDTWHAERTEDVSRIPTIKAKAA